jgi:hypothetical protein
MSGPSTFVDALRAYMATLAELDEATASIARCRENNVEPGAELLERERALQKRVLETRTELWNARHN